MWCFLDSPCAPASPTMCSGVRLERSKEQEARVALGLFSHFGSPECY